MLLNFRHYRYEQTLAGLLWKVDMKDVTVINIENSECHNLKAKSIVSLWLDLLNNFILQ